MASSPADERNHCFQVEHRISVLNTWRYSGIASPNLSPHQQRSLQARCTARLANFNSAPAQGQEQAGCHCVCTWESFCRVHAGKNAKQENIHSVENHHVCPLAAVSKQHLSPAEKGRISPVQSKQPAHQLQGLTPTYSHSSVLHRGAWVEVSERRGAAPTDGRATLNLQTQVLLKPILPSTITSNTRPEFPNPFLLLTPVTAHDG